MGILLKVGNAPVGLHGLDGALTELLRKHGRDDITGDEAAEMLLAKIEKRNYIPDSARKRYLEALARLWDARVSGEDRESFSERRVRILGPGCTGCNRLESVVMEVFNELGIAADIEHVRELDEIWRYGVIKTPALVIGSRVLSSGRIPSRAMVEKWIRDLFGL